MNPGPYLVAWPRGSEWRNHVIASTDPLKGILMNKKLIASATMAGGMLLGTLATAQAAPAPDVWLCHFDGHEATAPYGDDRNGAAAGFWSTPEGEFLDGDYVARKSGDGSAPNAGQMALCEGNGGTFELVNANSAEKGHRAQNLVAIATYES